MFEDTMNFPDHSPAPISFNPPPFPSGEACGFWPQSPMDSDQAFSQSQFDHVPPFKRPRNHDPNVPNSAPFSSMDSRTSHGNPSLNRGTSNIFFKTRMCVKFMDGGNCRNGDTCSFAHGREDLREPPPNWQDIVREKDRIGNWRKICRKFSNGKECPYGDKCNFVHESPTNFKDESYIPQVRESSAISIATMGRVIENISDSNLGEANKHHNATSDAVGVNMKPVYWKTKICSKWENTGFCHFGDRCNYAHGKSDVQLPVGHIETEEVMNITLIQKKAFQLPVNDVLPTKMVVGVVPTKECGEKNKGLSKWKLNKKINCIYGDWPEDLIPPEQLPSTMVG